MGLHLGGATPWGFTRWGIARATDFGSCHAPIGVYTVGVYTLGGYTEAVKNLEPSMLGVLMHSICVYEGI